MAPEVLLGGEPSSKADVWSFGIVLIEFLSYGRDPYPMMDNNVVRTKVCQEKYRLPLPPDCPNAIADLIQKCFSYDPLQRPSFRECFGILTSYLDQPGNNLPRSDSHDPKHSPTVIQVNPHSYENVTSSPDQVYDN